MTKYIVSAAVAALVALSVDSLALAQAPPPQPLRSQPAPAAQPPRAGGAPVQGTVALIDMEYIFKNHDGIKQQMERADQEALAAENEIKAKRDAIQKLEDQMKAMEKGSQGYAQLEQDVTQRKIQLQTEYNIIGKRLSEMRAKITYDNYQRVWNEVRYYSEQNNVTLVLQFNRTSPSKNNPEEMVRQMMQPVMYYHHTVDITDAIFQRMGGQPPAANTAARPAARPQPQPLR